MKTIGRFVAVAVLAVALLVSGLSIAPAKHNPTHRLKQRIVKLNQRVANLRSELIGVQSAMQDRVRFITRQGLYLAPIVNDQVRNAEPSCEGQGAVWEPVPKQDNPNEPPTLILSC